MEWVAVASLVADWPWDLCGLESFRCSSKCAVR